MTFPSQPISGNSRTQPGDAEGTQVDRPARGGSEVPRPEVSTTDLIAAICHDLRPHLGLLKGFAESVRHLIDSPDRANRDYMLRGLVTSAERIGELSSQLLDVVTIGSVDPSSRSCALVDLIRAAENDLVLLLRPGQSVVVESLPTVSVAADPFQIRWVLRNLLMNASQYSAPNQSIMISARAEPSRVIISVADRGVGIDLPSQPRIFEGRYRSEDARRLADGVGLGLFLCRRIVEAHGGEIWFQSASGVGSTFHFSLARSEVDQVPPTDLATSTE